MPKLKKSHSAEKCPKVWEKARRDKLKSLFDELARLLPVHDPASPLSRTEIIQGAMDHIRQLQTQNEDLLNHKFDEVSRNKIEKLKQRVKELVCRVGQLSEILRTAKIHVPSLASETSPTAWSKMRPWTKRIFVSEEKVTQVLEKLSQPKSTKVKSSLKVVSKVKKVKKKKSDGKDKSKQSKENHPADTLLNLKKTPKEATITPLQVSPSSVSVIEGSTSNTTTVPITRKILSAQPTLFQPQVPQIIQGNIVAQPNTYILTDQGNLLPILTPTTNVITPVIINRPPPLLVVQQPMVPQTWKTFAPVVAHPPPNKRRIERASTVMTYTNKLPISALSKQSHTRRSGKCASHKTEKSISNGQLSPSSISNVVSPTANFLNTFPVVSTTKSVSSEGLTAEKDLNSENTIKQNNLEQSSSEKGCEKEEISSRIVPIVPSAHVLNFSEPCSSSKPLSPISSVIEAASVKDHLKESTKNPVSTSTFSSSVIPKTTGTYNNAVCDATTEIHVQPNILLPITVSTADICSTATAVTPAANTCVLPTATSADNALNNQFPLLPSFPSKSLNSTLAISGNKEILLASTTKTSSAVVNEPNPSVALSPIPAQRGVEFQVLGKSVISSKTDTNSLGTITTNKNITPMSMCEITAKHRPIATEPMTVSSSLHTSIAPLSHTVTSSITNKQSVIQQDKSTNIYPPSHSSVLFSPITERSSSSSSCFTTISTIMSTSSNVPQLSIPLLNSVIPSLTSPCVTTKSSHKLPGPSSNPKCNPDESKPNSSFMGPCTGITNAAAILKTKTDGTNLISSTCQNSPCSIIAGSLPSSTSSNISPATSSNTSIIASSFIQTPVVSSFTPTAQTTSIATSICDGNTERLNLNKHLPSSSTNAPTYHTFSVAQDSNPAILLNKRDTNLNNLLLAPTPSIWPSYSTATTTSVFTVSSATLSSHVDVTVSSTQFSNPLLFNPLITTTAGPLGGIPKIDSFNGVTTNPFAQSWAQVSTSSTGSWPSIKTTLNHVPSSSANTNWLSTPATSITTLSSCVKLPDNPAGVDWRSLPSEALWSSMEPWSYSHSSKQCYKSSKLPSLISEKTKVVTTQPCVISSSSNDSNIQLNAFHDTSAIITHSSTDKGTNILYGSSTYNAVSKIPLSENSIPVLTSSVATQFNYQSSPKGNIPCFNGSHSTRTGIEPHLNLPIVSVSSTACQSNEVNISAQNMAKQISECQPCKSSSIHSSVTKSTTSLTPFVSSSTKSLLGEPLFPSGSYPIHDSTLYNSIGEHGYSTPILKPPLPDGSYITSFASAFSTESSFSNQSYTFSNPRTMLPRVSHYSLTPSKTSMTDVNLFPSNTIETMYQGNSGTQGKIGEKNRCINNYSSDCNQRHRTSKPTSEQQYSSGEVNQNVSTYTVNLTPTSIPQKNMNNIASVTKETLNVRTSTSSSKQSGNNTSNLPWNSAYLSQNHPITSEYNASWTLDYACTSDSKDTKPKAPINWMTEPDPRIDGICSSEDPFQQRYQGYLDKKEAGSSQNMFDYCLTNLTEEETGKSRVGKKKEGDGSCQDYCSWFSMKVDPLVVPCTLPTLVGDLALGSEPTPVKRPKFSDPRPEKEVENVNAVQEPYANLSKNIFDCSTHKANNSNETIVLKNIFELPTPTKRKVNQGQNSFLSVSYLVEPNTGEEVNGKNDCNYYGARAKAKRGGSWKCAEKKCQQPQDTKSCSNYSTEAILKSTDEISQIPIPESELSVHHPTMFAQDYVHVPVENHQIKPKTYHKQRKQEIWKNQDMQQPPVTFPSLIPTASSTQTFTPAKSVKSAEMAPFSYSYLPDARLPSPQAPNIAIQPSSSVPLQYPQFHTNPPAPLFVGPTLSQQKPIEAPPFTSVFPSPPNRPCGPGDKARYPGPRKPYSYSRTSKIPFPQFSPSFAYDNSKKNPSKSSIPIVQCSKSVFPAPLPVGGTYPSFPSLATQPIGSSGNSLANFNLTTIFPEMNKKGNYQYP